MSSSRLALVAVIASLLAGQPALARGYPSDFDERPRVVPPWLGPGLAIMAPLATGSILAPSLGTTTPLVASTSVSLGYVAVGRPERALLAVVVAPMLVYAIGALTVASAPNWPRPAGVMDLPSASPASSEFATMLLVSGFVAWDVVGIWNRAREAEDAATRHHTEPGP